MRIRSKSLMQSQFKINTANLIFLAFIFRLLFLNIGSVSANNSGNFNVSKEFKLTTKSNNELQFTFESKENQMSSNSFFDYFEEGSADDDDDIFKSTDLIEQSSFDFFTREHSIHNKTKASYTSPNITFLANSRNIYFQVFRI